VAAPLRPALLGLTQAAVGGLLTARPRPVALAASGPGGTPAPAAIVRVLGLRSLAQGAVTATVATPPVLVGGALVDVAHALSMIPLIVAVPRYRRAAAISAALAVASATAGATAARRLTEQPA